MHMNRDIISYMWTTVYPVSRVVLHIIIIIILYYVYARVADRTGLRRDPIRGGPKRAEFRAGKTLR